MQRMQGKEGGSKSSGPDHARQASQQTEQQEAVGNVEEQIGNMVAGGPQTVELTIQHMRQPGQRMPITGIAAGERPPDAFHREAGLDAPVAADVVRVVKVDES